MLKRNLYLNTLLFADDQVIIQDDTKKRALLKNPTKIEEIEEKKKY